MDDSAETEDAVNGITEILRVRRLADLAADIDARGPRRWLVRGIWPAGDYGVHGAEPKAQKTFNALDASISVASGTPWLGSIPTDTTGPVLVFAGEGGDAGIVRRLRAIAAGRGLDIADLDVFVCPRAPHLRSSAHLALLARHIADIQPALVVLDPLYLAAGGASGADLYAMGQLLERPQHICQDAGAALLVVTHFNRLRDLRGASRLTGAGPAEWGRVLIAASVISRNVDPATKASTVLTELDITGGEIPDQTLRVRRRVWSDDPDNIDSPLHYDVAVLDSEQTPGTFAAPNLTPAGQKLLEAVNADSEPASIRQLVDRIAAEHGHGLRRQTCSAELGKLAKAGLVDFVDQGNGREKLWLPVTDPSCDRSGDRYRSGVTGGVTDPSPHIRKRTGQSDRFEVTGPGYDWPSGVVAAEIRSGDS